MELDKIYNGDALSVLRAMDDESVDCIVTSPPYWQLRDYGVDGQLGLESDFREYITKLLEIFEEAKRVLKRSGTCFVVIGDTYSGDKVGITDDKRLKYRDNDPQINKKTVGAPRKCLLQIPSRFALGMTDNGWILRNEIIWHKPNAMPDSVTDRFTVSHETVFFFAKSEMYFFDQEAVMEESIYQPGSRPNQTKDDFHGKHADPDGYRENAFRAIREKRNKRDVWTIPTSPSSIAHYAMFPRALIEPMILAGCPEDGIVLDPFIGSGTTGIVAKANQRHYIGIELNPQYAAMAQKRINESCSQITMYEVLKDGTPTEHV